MTIKLLDKPGMYDRIPMEEYHGQLTVGPSVSSSGLRTIFNESPADYFDTSYLNPEKDDDEEKEAFILGRAAHHLLLGEDDFSTLFVMRPEKAPDGRDWNGNNNTCKDWLKKQADAGRTVLTPLQIEKIRGMAKGLAKHPLIQAGIMNGQIEQTLVWKDKETGVWLKIRPDSIPNDSGDVCDLKTTSMKGYDIDNHASKLRYDMQAALVKWGLREVLKVEMQSFSLAFVRSKRPHIVDILTFHTEDIAQAETDLRVAINTFAHCLKTGEWFGPGGTQRDARYLAFSKHVRDRAEWRRDYLRREVARPTGNEPSALDYAATP